MSDRKSFPISYPTNGKLFLSDIMVISYPTNGKLFLSVIMVISYPTNGKPFLSDIMKKVLTTPLFSPNNKYFN
jgi:hypothetical protein